jgi:mediator of RNA polymerase II transcription subunit 25
MLRYGGKSMEELGSILKEKNISLSILAPRKIPSLYNIFDKAGGDLLQVSHLDGVWGFC